MQYGDRMLANLKTPDQAGQPIYDLSRPGDAPDLKLPETAVGENMTGPSFNLQMRQMQVSKENMRRFIKTCAKFSMGTDTGSFLNFQQETPAPTR